MNIVRYIFSITLVFHIFSKLYAEITTYNTGEDVELVNFHHKMHMIGKHRSTAVENSHLIANEFQLISPENIVDVTKEDHHLHIEDILFKQNTAKYQISVSPRLINGGDIVEVSFYSLEASSSDWIGAYSPADVDIR
jgi:hypothetical protein